jgi:hypothetical protein
MTASTDIPATRPRHLTLRIVLILFSISKLLSALIDLPSLQIVHTHPTPGWRFASHVSDTRTVLAPLIAGTAFVFAVAGMLPRAIMAMAALILVRALAELAWVYALRGASLPLDLLSAQILATRYVYPMLAVAALVLVRRGMRLGLAGALVSIPTGLVWLYWIVVFVLITTDPD